MTGFFLGLPVLASLCLVLAYLRLKLPKNIACIGSPEGYNLLVMHAVMEALVQLQKLEFGADCESPSAKDTIEKLRSQVPYQILGHYDRLRARGKKGIALVRHLVCTECHMSIPLGTVQTVMKGLDIQLCGNCGRYLYVLPETAPAVEEPKVVSKPKRVRVAKPKVQERVRP